MATLTIPQIAQLAVNVGVQNGSNLYTAAAIALAESSGRTDATNTANDNGTVDKGLWQINSVHDDKMPGADRFDPEVNAQLMAQISDGGTNWYPWSTYNNGAYVEYLAQVQSTLGGTALTPNGGLGAGTGPGNGLTYENAGFMDDMGDLADGFGSGLAAVEKFFGLITSVDGWIRILKVYCGCVAVLGGLVLVVRTSETGKQITKAALTVVPGGKAVTAVTKTKVAADAAKTVKPAPAAAAKTVKPKAPAAAAKTVKLSPAGAA
ncbi:transglycosylase SLT domain-containing protein [Nocardia sp. NPDC001965]